MGRPLENMKNLGLKDRNVDQYHPLYEVEILKPPEEVFSSNTQDIKAHWEKLYLNPSSWNSREEYAT